MVGGGDNGIRDKGEGKKQRQRVCGDQTGPGDEKYSTRIMKNNPHTAKVSLWITQNRLRNSMPSESRMKISPRLRQLGPC